MEIPSEDYLFEIGTEELPSGVIVQWEKGFKSPVAAAKNENILTTESLFEKWKLKADSIKYFATPRRLTLYIESLSSRQETETRDIKGPSIDVAFNEEGKPTMAAIGFSRSQNADVSELIKGEDGYVYVHKETPGKDTSEIIPEIAGHVFNAFSPPKTMRWGTGQLRFSRPVRWIVSLYGDSHVQVSLDGITSSNRTMGHRFLSNKPVSLTTSKEYRSKLKENNVLLGDERKKNIEEGIKKTEKATGLVRQKEDFDVLLEEVTRLAESPRAVPGSFDPKYLSMPKAVLSTSMKSHQRYFPLEDTDGAMAPQFIVVHNSGEQADENIIKGNERVLSARLEDAYFFYKDDTSKPLESFVPKLKGLAFHSKLGDMYQKTERIQKLAMRIAEISGMDKGKFILLKRAAELCKADLVTQMVVEFPVLQGTMGKEYAILSGETGEVSDALLEHYYPKSRHKEAELPETEIGTVLALADKVDGATSLLFVETPTASKDPYGIRRLLSGTVRIMIEKNISEGLYGLVMTTADSLAEQDISISREKIDDILKFYIDEIQSYKLNLGTPLEPVDAVLTSIKERGFGEEKWMGEVNPLNISQMIDSLSGLSNDGKESIAKPFIRCRNLSNPDMGYEVDMEIIGDPEKSLIEFLGQVKENLTREITQQNYSKALDVLAGARPGIDNFFDEVLIMAKDENLKKGRIAILNRIVEIYKKYADFSKLGI